jgi:hypothetical protein
MIDISGFCLIELDSCQLLLRSFLFGRAVKMTADEFICSSIFNAWVGIYPVIAIIPDGIYLQ